MQPLPLKFAGLLGLVLAWGQLSAQDAPRLGILYGTQEVHPLTYDCKPVRSGELTCQFVQVAVRKKATDADLPAALEKARNAFATEKPPSAAECTLYRDALDWLDGKKTPPKPDAIDAMSQIQKNDMRRLWKAMIDYCDRPTEKTFLALARLEHDKDRRTCTVSLHSYTHSFRLAPGSSWRSVWVAESSPEGPCGLVQLSRFESGKTDSGRTVWTYVARKAVTNPSAEFVPGGKCSQLDEASYTYYGRSEEHQMSCDYIEFTPLQKGT